MDRDFWQARWDEGRIGFHQDEINPYLRQYWGRLALGGTGKIFVPLCGKSKDMLWLRGQGHDVMGVEIVPRAVEDFFSENKLEAKTRVEGHFTVWEGGGIRLFCGDIFALGPAQLVGVAGVYDRASLIALPPAMRQRYADHLRNILQEPVKRLLVTMDYPQAEMEGPPFAVTEQEVDALFKDSFLIEQLGAANVLAANTRFQEQGLTRLYEKVYLLTPRHVTHQYES